MFDKFNTCFVTGSKNASLYMLDNGFNLNLSTEANAHLTLRWLKDPEVKNVQDSLDIARNALSVLDDEAFDVETEDEMIANQLSFQKVLLDGCVLSSKALELKVKLLREMRAEFQKFGKLTSS